MRTMKSLLLGAAAGLVAVAGAQAADLPVKAKAVEYVKICSAYGAGFYYIPGTDICLRVGGYVFTEGGVKAVAANVNYPIDRDTNYFNHRSRGHVILDARQQTAYGTLRAYTAFGVSHTNAGGGASGGTTAASLDRAFIEFAGFTAGFTETFFSFGGAYSIVSSRALSWDWLTVLAYTAQLGNGLTASLSLENGQHTRTTDGLNAGAMTYAGGNVPDIVGNIRVTQAWGRAQIMGALHEVRPNSAGLTAGADRKWGWAVGAGFEVKTPQTGNPNNSFLLQGVYTEGNVERTGIAGSPAGTTGVIPWGTFGAATVGFGDAYIVGGSTRLTEAWSVYAGYRHYWTPMLRTGFAYGHTEIDPPTGSGAGSTTLQQAHVSTIWSPVSGLDLSLDLVYTDISRGAGAALPSASDDLWTAWYRIRRNF